MVLGNRRAARLIYQQCYLHHVTPLHTLHHQQVLQGGFALPTLKRMYCIALKRPHQLVPESLCMEWVCLVLPSGRFCMNSNYTLIIPIGYMQCIQPILHSVLISVCFSYTNVWKSPSLHDRYFPPMNVGSLGTLFYTHETAMFWMTKPPMDSSNVLALMCGQVLWTVI